MCVAPWIDLSSKVRIVMRVALVRSVADCPRMDLGPELKRSCEIAGVYAGARNVPHSTFDLSSSIVNGFYEVCTGFLRVF
jgi:hypothetical protein